MWQDAAKSNRRADKRVELFVTSDGKLKVARRDALDLEVLGSILCKGRSVWERATRP